MTWRPPAQVIGAVAMVAAIAGGTVLLAGRGAAARPASQPTRYAGALGALALTPVLRPATLPAAVAVTLVRDPASVAFHDDTAAYDRVLERWREELVAVGATVTIRGPAALAQVREPLVVPYAPCLSPATRDALLAAAATGQGVLVTGMTGTRDGGCRAVGWGLLAQLMGAARADTVASGADTYVTVAAGGPLAIDVPPGARVALERAPHVAVRSPRRDAHYSDAWLNPSAARAPLMDGAIVRGEAPRVAFLGFELVHVADRSWDRAVARLIVRNLVAHIAGVPLAAPAAWPEGRVAAAAIAQDVEDEFENARLALDELRAARVTGTFFIVSQIASEHRKLTRDLAAAGEIASHTVDHRRLGGAPDEDQAQWLVHTQEEIEALTGRRADGLRPPEEQFDPSTIDAWQAAGGRYLFAANDGRCACPELVRASGAPMVLLGRTSDDDFMTVRRAGMTDARLLADDQLAAWGKVRALGGLYIMSYHSNMLARPVTVGAIGHVARALRADTTAWLTTTGAVARWWASRHALRTTVRAAGDTLHVSVENPGTASVDPFLLDLSLPDARTLRAHPALRDQRPGGARVRVARLAPGATTQLTLFREPADAR